MINPTDAADHEARELIGMNDYGPSVEVSISRVARALRTRDTRIAALEARLDDATRYCSGEFPCEASTAAASFEKECKALRSQLNRIREFFCDFYEE